MQRPPLYKLAILGQPQCGKTLLFCIASNMNYEELRSDIKHKTAMIKIRDSRLKLLHNIAGHDKELVYPSFQIFDTPGLDLNSPNAELLGHLREMDALLVVLKTFDGIDAKEEMLKITKIFEESDMAIIQNRLDKLRKKCSESEKTELNALEQILNTRNFKEPDPYLKHFGFLQSKQIFELKNTSEKDITSQNTNSTSFCIKLEFELLNLNDDERSLYLKEYGLEALGSSGLFIEIFKSMGYNLFFTVGNKEIAGWGITNGKNALDAAGVIHTDFAKGFIKAEVLGFNDFLKSKTLKNFRTESKEYIVNDGDIIQFKFNI